MATARRQQTDRTYNKFQRDADAARFYKSARWRKVRAAMVLAEPVCQRCGLRPTEIVHHFPIELADCTEAQAVDPANLQCVCRPCHGSAHGEKPAAIQQVTGQITPVDDDEYYFDEEKASRLGRFSAKFCHHFRGTKSGQPFELHPIQQAIVRPVFGFVHRETGLRRFNFLYFESAIGTGKTPLLAIIGLFGLLGDGENGAQIYSLASTHGQAEHMFKMAKAFIKNGPLQRFVDRGSLVVKQYEIAWKPTDSVWEITSGSGGKAGGAASVLLVDEVHQIENREAYDDLQGRQKKRDQPLTVCMTNAAKEPFSLYADLHEQAADTLTGGRRASRRMFPVIWAAPVTADPASPATWKIANKLIGTTIQESDVADEYNQAKLSPALLNRFRLQYLGQRVSDRDKWLDAGQWDTCSTLINPHEIKDAPRYVALDMSRVDDLSAIVDIFPTEAKFYAKARFLMPRATADAYRESHEIPYDRWERAGAIELIEDLTISTAVQERLAADIIASHQTHPIECVCYDRAYSEGIVKLIAAAGIKCEGVGQGWGVASGCDELARRLKEGSIAVEKNPVMRFCADNVEVKADERGNIWPVKPAAKGKYAGKKHLKIDGITALVTGLTVAKQHKFKPKPHVGAVIVEL